MMKKEDLYDNEGDKVFVRKMAHYVTPQLSSSVWVVNNKLAMKEKTLLTTARNQVHYIDLLKFIHCTIRKLLKSQ